MLLKGDVLEARGLPPGCRPSVKVLYVEPGDGANMMFRCKTAVHETDAAATVAQAAGEDTVEWRRGEFSFELLGGARDTGDALFACNDVQPSGAARFIGQVVIALAAVGTSEEGIDGWFALTGRDGAALPGGTWLRLRLRVLAAGGAPPVRLGWDDGAAARAAAQPAAESKAKAKGARAAAARPTAAPRRPAPGPDRARAPLAEVKAKTKRAAGAKNGPAAKPAGASARAGGAAPAPKAAAPKAAPSAKPANGRAAADPTLAAKAAYERRLAHEEQIAQLKAKVAALRVEGPLLEAQAQRAEVANERSAASVKTLRRKLASIERSAPAGALEARPPPAARDDGADARDAADDAGGNGGGDDDDPADEAELRVLRDRLASLRDRRAALEAGDRDARARFAAARDEAAELQERLAEANAWQLAATRARAYDGGGGAAVERFPELHKAIHETRVALATLRQRAAASGKAATAATTPATQDYSDDGFELDDGGGDDDDGRAAPAAAEVDGPAVGEAAQREYAPEIRELRKEVSELEASLAAAREDNARARERRDKAASDVEEWHRHSYPAAVHQICSALQGTRRLWAAHQRKEAQY